MLLDVTTTAMARPDIVEQTYESFTRNLKGVEWGTCYINIDPLPSNVDRYDVVKVAEKYFKNVSANLPEEPNYTAAYNWVWSNAKTDHILNLEDDWELVREIHIDDLMRFFKQNPSLYEVVLRAYTYRYPCTCTSPAILSRKYYSAIGGKLDISRNPETQTHSRQDLGIFIPNKNNCPYPEKYVIAYPIACNTPDNVIVKDIGREWLENSKFIRPQMLSKDDPRYLKKCNFVKWIEK